MKYEMFISAIATYYARNNLIKEDQIDAFKYGASLTFASIISLAIAFGWGAVFNCIPEVCVFLLLFIPLRIFTGGYHASTFLSQYNCPDLYDCTLKGNWYEKNSLKNYQFIFAWYLHVTLCFERVFNQQYIDGCRCDDENEFQLSSITGCYIQPASSDADARFDDNQSA